MERIYLTNEFFKNEGLRPFTDMKNLASLMRYHTYVLSWGAHAFTNVENKILRFRVQGRLFKGLVWIAPNGLDLFNIYFSTGRRSDNGCYRLLDTIKNIYLEDLMEVIDRKVETP